MKFLPIVVTHQRDLWYNDESHTAGYHPGCGQGDTIITQFNKKSEHSTKKVKIAYKPRVLPAN